MPRVGVLKQLPRELLAAASVQQLRSLTEEQLEFLTSGAATDAEQALNLFQVSSFPPLLTRRRVAGDEWVGKQRQLRALSPDRTVEPRSQMLN
jgi:hypothetical protein